MLELELALSRVLSQYGSIRGKHSQLCVDYGKIEDILDTLKPLTIAIKYIGNRYSGLQLTYSDNSKIWISVSGGILWRFNFLPQVWELTLFPSGRYVADLQR